ncbi:FAD/NAD(P)-binding protein [Rhodopila sp.]|uniref:FAD/NAD(P)-binding protein n=1 Tax=Rhodopila sp. TaxID=2480087 RepID=UPI002B60ADE9|nr:FAD/NAD(P)-binding protein [Rhodopila sp.]HVZ06801.1 FAD/NAD(P)-binding protein [Rhodopila sp.]
MPDATASRAPGTTRSPDAADGSTIAVIGAGFSGTLLTLHLVRRCPANTRIILLERGGAHGPGVAYGTPHACHLLNVPAGRMSAFPDRPLDFLHWLQARPGTASSGPAAASPDLFAPRAVYGAYLRDLLQQAMRDPAVRGRLTLVHDGITRLEQTGKGLRLHGSHGASTEVDLAVLATGNLQPDPIPVGNGAFYATPLYRHDPLASGALDGLDPDAAVLLMGTGLTMIDTVLTLLNKGHRGPIQAVSRRGLVPHRHAPAGPLPQTAAALPTNLRQLTRFVRAQASAAAEAGSDWRAVIDSLRPFTADLWQALSPADQKRFLRHVRPWWDIHRHRMAGPVADRIDAARETGQLHIFAGHLHDLAVQDETAVATIRPRGGSDTIILRAARVLNCTGPGTECARLRDPLLRALLRNGIVRPDPLGLALDVAATGAVRGRDGTLSRCVFAIGPLTRAAFWEMTAVPDIRRQCDMMARHLSTLVKPAR